MKTESSIAVLVLAALASLFAGCSNSVEDVCDDLADSCTGLIKAECLRDGAELEQAAEERGCQQPFGSYLDCAAGASCNWTTACASERAALEACGVVFPH